MQCALYAYGKNFHVSRKEDFTAVCRDENAFATRDLLPVYIAFTAHTRETNEAVFDLEFDRICKVWFV